MIGSRIGECYTYTSEADMLEMANKLEAEDYAVERKRDNYMSGKFRVTIVGYKNSCDGCVRGRRNG